MPSPLPGPQSVPLNEKVDFIPRWIAFLRTLRPLRVIAHRSLGRPYETGEFLEAIRNVQAEVARENTPKARSVGAWRLEKLGYSYCDDAAHSLRDPAIPLEAQPILHVGLGVSASERARLQPQKIREIIEAQAHPEHRWYPYESVGCIWVVFAHRGYRTLFQILSGTRLPKCEVLPWRDFVREFDPPLHPLLSHGYGRTLYFKAFDADRAIREALETEALDVAAAVQGIAFAYAFLNHRVLPQILRAEPRLTSSGLQEPFDQGLIFALAFREWLFPGSSSPRASPKGRAARLVGAAEELVAEGRRIGQLPPFGL